jgi:hypothetical protein
MLNWNRSGLAFLLFISAVCPVCGAKPTPGLNCPQDVFELISSFFSQTCRRPRINPSSWTINCAT